VTVVLVAVVVDVVVVKVVSLHVLHNTGKFTSNNAANCVEPCEGSQKAGTIPWQKSSGSGAPKHKSVLVRVVLVIVLVVIVVVTVVAVVVGVVVVGIELHNFHLTSELVPSLKCTCNVVGTNVVVVLPKIIAPVSKSKWAVLSRNVRTDAGFWKKMSQVVNPVAL
jgi:hypothetical protein